MVAGYGEGEDGKVNGRVAGVSPSCHRDVAAGTVTEVLRF